MIADLDVPIQVQYLTTGDAALLMAWSSPPPVMLAGDLSQISRARLDEFSKWLRANSAPKAILCLEDGRAVEADLAEIKFDYRYDIQKGRFVDVTGFGTDEEGEGSADTDQAAPDHGSEGVPGYVPDADGSSPGDPGDPRDGDLGGLAAGSEPPEG